MPWKPALPTNIFHFDISDEFAQIVQQRGVDDDRRPAFGLRGLIFRRCIRWKKITLPQPCGIAGGFQAVIEQTARVGVVVVFRGRKRLRQFRKTMERRQPEAFERRGRERGALTDKLNKLLAGWFRQQDFSGFRMQPSLRGVWFASGWCGVLLFARQPYPHNGPFPFFGYPRLSRRC